jgi:D-alanyl-D-alanine carboxypeptidase
VSTLTAKAFVIYDPVDKTVLLQKNMNQVRSIASISKLFTAMVALDALPFDQKFILSSSAKTLGSASGMSIGTRFDLSTAITYLLIRSSNDIANQIALTHDALYGYAGKTFASKMTNKARVIGLNNTAFSGPSGLENDNVSTAYELALTIDYMRENYPELLSLARQRYVERGGKSLESSNPVRSQSGWLGGKNGYITKSGRTTASLFTVNDKEVIVVHLGSVIDDDGHDNQALLQLVK